MAGQPALHPSLYVLLVEDSILFTLGAWPRFVLDHVWSRFRRDVTYAIDFVVRGRYKVGLDGPATDPFGMVELKRAFSDVGTLIVTPTVHKLPAVRLAGEWSGSGESRLRAIAAAGEEDATIRAYFVGDDMRRVHWRATAHHGEPACGARSAWQSRPPSLPFDTCTAGAPARASTPRSSGASPPRPPSASTWLSAATPSGSPPTTAALVSTNWHDPASGPRDAKVSLLDALAVVQLQRDASVGRWPDLPAAPRPPPACWSASLVGEPEAWVVASLRQGSTAALAVVLDVMTWTSLGENNREQARLTGCRGAAQRRVNVIVAQRGEHLASLWERLGPCSGRCLRTLSSSLLGHAGHGPAARTKVR